MNQLPLTLYRSIKRIRSKDLNLDRVILFKSHLESKPFYKLVYELASMTKLTGFFLSIAFALLKLTRLPLIKSFHFYDMPNELKTLKKLNRQLNKSIPIISSQGKGLERLLCLIEFLHLGLMNLRKLPQLIRILWKLCDHQNLFSTMRLYLTVFNRIYYYKFLRSNIIKSIFVSSDGSPFSTPLLAMTDRKFKIFFACHGAINSIPSRINADCGIFFGNKSFSQYKEAGAEINEVLYFPATAKINFSDIEFNKDINLLYSLEKIETREEVERFNFIKELPANFKLNFREHPHNLVGDRKRLIDFDATISNFDLHFAGNTNTHLEALRLGVISIYIPKRNHLSELSFIGEGVVYKFNFSQSMTENIKSALNFYQSSYWKESFNEYMSDQESPESFEERLNIIQST